MAWNIERGFLHKLKEFKFKKEEFILSLIKTSLEYAKENNVLNDEFEIEETANLFHRWFFLDNDKAELQISDEILYSYLSDYKKMAKILLRGLLKK